MKSSITRVLALYAIAALLIATSAAQDRPSRKNRSYNPAAATSDFGFVTTGAILKIKSAAVATAGTITARFTLTDSNGAGLDVNGVYTAGGENLAFVAAYIPNGQSQYVAYTTTVDKSTTNSNPSQVQASTDKGGTFTLVDAATGTYDYTFGTKAPANFDASATHTIGGQIERDLSAYGFPDQYANDAVFSFVPNGSTVTNVRDIVNEASCNSCHNPLSAHGGPRKQIAYCVLCHTPQSTNPDSLNTVDMKVFFHKIHRGSSLPSVVAGTPYYVEHRGSRQDYSTIEFPQDIRNCTSCHAARPTQADNWKTNPSRAVCGSCHDNVNFDTGLNHINLIETDDSQCKNCHVTSPTREFDASIVGAHTVPNNSAMLPGIVLKIVTVQNATAGNAPTVTYQVLDKKGNPVDVSKLSTFRLVMNGANVDYGTNGFARVSETLTKVAGDSTGTYVYTMTNIIPATATGSYTISLEAANNTTLLTGTTQQMAATDSAIPVEFYFSVDGSPLVTRRQVVSTEKCAACHQNLAFVHGGTRPAAQECTICHNPTLQDGTSKDSVNFATQIHSIHRGTNLANPYILGTRNYQDLRFPGDLRDCSTCHINNSYQVDNIGAVAPVMTAGEFLPTTLPIAAACQGCHDDKATASHALANTTALGEGCATCHGIGAQFAVDVVHARVF